jgi:hypothetical protein
LMGLNVLLAIVAQIGAMIFLPLDGPDITQ